MKSNLKSAVLSFLFLIFLSLISRAEQVVFSEINYNPRGDKPEYIEIYNLTATPKDISKWKMTEGVGYVFPDFDEADPSRTFLKKLDCVPRLSRMIVLNTFSFFFTLVNKVSS